MLQGLFYIIGNFKIFTTFLLHFYEIRVIIDKIKVFLKWRLKMNDNSIEQIINELSKIESLSDNIKNDTETKRDEYVQRKKDEFAEYDLQLQKETEEQLVVLKNNLNKKMNEDILLMRTQMEKKIDELEEEFGKVYVQEAKNIVDRIIKE